MTALSKTDKTRPWHIKVEEARQADPYTARHQSYPYAPGIWGCPASCYMCRGYLKEENRRDRRQGKRSARDWQKDY